MSATTWPHADVAVIDDPVQPVYCAACGRRIVLQPGEAMTFDTTPEGKLIAIHFEHDTRREDVTIGRAAGTKTCDDCGKQYAGPAYYTFLREACVTQSTEAGPVPHLACTENLCASCAGPNLEPDRPDDPRRVKA